MHTLQQLIMSAFTPELIQLLSLSCTQDEVIYQLSKVLEHICWQTMTKDRNVPLTSATQLLLTSTESDRRDYFSKIGKSIPIDITYVRLKLLGRRYERLVDFLCDMQQCFTHYESVKQTFQLPDVIPVARASFFGAFQRLNFVQFYPHEISEGILESAKSIDRNLLQEPESVITHTEVRNFLFLLELLDPSQRAELEELVIQILDPTDFSSTKDSVGKRTLSLSLNHLHPTKARQFMDQVFSQIATVHQRNVVKTMAQAWKVASGA